MEEVGEEGNAWGGHEEGSEREVCGGKKGEGQREESRKGRVGTLQVLHKSVGQVQSLEAV